MSEPKSGWVCQASALFVVVAVGVGCEAGSDNEESADNETEISLGTAGNGGEETQAETGGETETETLTPAFGLAEGGCNGTTGYEGSSDFESTVGTGFSAQSIIERLNALGTGTLTWYDETTSQIELFVSTEQSTVTLFDPPREQGFCPPTLTVQNARLKLTTSDGRLNEEVPCNIGATGYDGVVHAVFPSMNGLLDVDTLNGTFEPPSEWLNPSHTERSWVINFDVYDGGTLGAYCIEGEERSTDPMQSCNVYDGVLRYHSQTPDETTDIVPEGAMFDAVMGWWEWNEG